MAATECDNPIAAVGCFINDVTDGVGDVVEGVSGVVSFAQDPFGATLKALKDGAKSLTTDVLPFLTTALQPDLSAGFFLRAYAVAFAAAVLVLMIIMIGLFVKVGKGDMAGRDLVQSLAGYVPMFFIGAMYGPLAGIILVKLFHALTDSVITWAMGSAQQIIDGLIALIDKIDPAATPGGVILAIVLMFLLLIGLLLVVVILLCQLVTLYFSGILIPLALVWLADPNRRRLALGMVGLWVGILASHPLLFFLLGFAFSIMGDTLVTIGSKDGLQTLVTFIVALIAIYMAALSPLLMMKFAPILAPVFTPAPSGGGGGGDVGHSNITDATNEYGNGGREGSDRSSSSTSTDGGGSGSSSSTNTSTDKTLQEAAANNESGPGGREKAPVGAGSAAEGAEAGEAAAGGEGAAAGLAEAGAAESSTGAGAAVGIPTLAVAAAVGAAEAAKSGADSAVSQATAPMDGSTL